MSCQDVSVNSHPSSSVTGQPDTDLIVRPLRESDLDEAARVLAEAFSSDPVWGPAFPQHPERLAHAAAHWRMLTAQSIRYGESRVAVADDGTMLSVAVWFPPGAEEMSEQDEPVYERLLRESIGDAAAEHILSFGPIFAGGSPEGDYAYLSLLGVASAARGHGYGMRLVQASLDDYDRRGIDTYLESSNAANDARYERLGYQPQTRLEFPGGVPVQTYFRAAPRTAHSVE